MTLRRILVGKLITNCYLLLFSDRAAVIDPGDMPEKILKNCEGLPITDILLTHGHLDHTAALGDLCDRFSPRVWMHEEDLDFLNEDTLRDPVSPVHEPWWRHDYVCTDPLSHGDVISLGEGEEAIQLHVLHTPGHTPGSVGYYLKEQNILFSGDTLFKGAEGRTDFPRSDPEKMRSSLKFLSTLPEETKVYPGHGFATTIGAEGWICGEDAF